MAQHPPARPAPRVVTRAVIDFVVGSGRAIARALNGDLPGGLALLALMNARNARPPLRDADPSTDAERPVAVQSLARSLKIPPETMRRSIGRLIARGWCIRVDTRGVIVTEEALNSTELRELVDSIRTEFRRMLADLRSIGFDFDVMDRTTEEYADVVPEMEEDVEPEATADLDGGIFDRVIFEFLLRVVEGALPAHGDDYVRSYVFTAIMSANAAPFAYDPQEAWRYATHETPPPDQMRRPVSLSELSQILEMPYETTRRYVNRLIAIGHCVRDENKGITIPTSVAQSPELLSSGLEVTKRFSQTIGELKRRGFNFRAVVATGSTRLQALASAADDTA